MLEALTIWNKLVLLLFILGMFMVYYDAIKNVRFSEEMVKEFKNKE